MTVIKKYNEGTDQWETVLVGKAGPQGPTGPAALVSSATAPVDTNAVWLDTSVSGDMVLPPDGLTGQVLAKASGTDYDTEWVGVSDNASVVIAAQVFS